MIFNGYSGQCYVRQTHHLFAARLPMSALVLCLFYALAAKRRSACSLVTFMSTTAFVICNCWLQSHHTSSRVRP